MLKVPERCNSFVPDDYTVMIFEIQSDFDGSMAGASMIVCLIITFMGMIPIIIIAWLLSKLLPSEASL